MSNKTETLALLPARAMMGSMIKKNEMNGMLLFRASDVSQYITGANLIVDGSWTKR